MICSVDSESGYSASDAPGLEENKFAFVYRGFHTLSRQLTLKAKAQSDFLT